MVKAPIYHYFLNGYLLRFAKLACKNAQNATYMGNKFTANSSYGTGNIFSFDVPGLNEITTLRNRLS